MSKAKDFRDQSIEELQALYEDHLRQLFLLKNASKMERKNDKPHEIKHARKTIARLLTVLAEKQSNLQNQAV